MKSWVVLVSVVSLGSFAVACGADEPDGPAFLQVTVDQAVVPAEDATSTRSEESSWLVTSAMSADANPLVGESITDRSGTRACSAVPVDDITEEVELADVDVLDAGEIRLSGGDDTVELSYQGETIVRGWPIAVGYPVESVEIGDGVSFHDGWSVESDGGDDIGSVAAEASVPTGFAAAPTVRYLDFERLEITPESADIPYTVELQYVDTTGRKIVTCEDVTGTFEWEFDPDEARVEGSRLYREEKVPFERAGLDGAFRAVASRSIAGAPPADKWVSFVVSQTVRLDGTRTLDISSRSGLEIEDAPAYPDGCEIVPFDDSLSEHPRIDVGDVTIAAGSMELMLATNDFEYFGEQVELDGPVDEWEFTATGGVDASNVSDTIPFGEMPESATISVSADAIEVAWEGPQRPYFEVAVSDGFLGETLRCVGQESPYVWERETSPEESVGGWVGSVSYWEDVSGWDTTDVVTVTRARRLAEVDSNL